MTRALRRPLSTRRRLAAAGALVTLVLVAVACGDDDVDHGPATTATPTGAAAEQGGSDVQRTSINPWAWSVELGFNQGELVTGGTRTLYLAGQSAVGPDGAPRHEGDLAAQIELALDNMEAVLDEAGLGLADVVRLDIYTTDVDGLFAEYGRIAGRLGAAGVQPPGSLLGVARLAYPELLVELAATAVA